MTTPRTNGNSPVPDGWRWARLGDISDVVGGSTPSRNESGFWGGEIPWVVPSALTALKSRYLRATKERITELGMASAGLSLLPSKSILLKSRATIGVAAINAMPVATNQGFQNLVVKEGIHSLWLYYCVRFRRQELERRASGSTFREVSRDSVRSFSIVLPPPHEQRAIAKSLDCIDRELEQCGRGLDALKELKVAVANVLLIGGARIGQYSSQTH